MQQQGRRSSKVGQHKQHDYGGFVPPYNSNNNAKAERAATSSVTSAAGGNTRRMRAYYQAETGGNALKTSHDPNLMYDTLPRTADDSRLRVRGRDRKYAQQASKKKSSCC